MKNHNEDDLKEAAEEAHFHEELTQFVKTLPKPDADSNKRYEQQLSFMNSIHGEVKQQYPHWRPEYNPTEEFDDKAPKGKYLEVVYSFNSQKSENSH